MVFFMLLLAHILYLLREKHINIFESDMVQHGIQTNATYVAIPITQSYKLQ